VSVPVVYGREQIGGKADTTYVFGRGKMKYNKMYANLCGCFSVLVFTYLFLLFALNRFVSEGDYMTQSSMKSQLLKSTGKCFYLFFYLSLLYIYISIPRPSMQPSNSQQNEAAATRAPYMDVFSKHKIKRKTMGKPRQRYVYARLSTKTDPHIYVLANENHWQAVSEGLIYYIISRSATY